MMSELRRPSEAQCSPKTSPRGNRSPVVVPRQDSTGTLKTTISLGKSGPAIVHSGPFYLMKELPPPDLTGNTNLIQYHNLEHSFNKFCTRKIKDSLSSFLPNLPGNIDVPASRDDSSLRKLIENPPITSIEIVPLTKQQLDSAFRLHVGPIPEQYRFMSQTVQRKKHKHKKSKQKNGDSMMDSVHNDANEGGLGSSSGGSGLLGSVGRSDRELHEKKHKKQKRHDEDKERRKKKKDKKKKKQRHSPDPHLVMMAEAASSGVGATGPMSNTSATVASPLSTGSMLSQLIGSSNGLGGPLTPNATSNGLNGTLGGGRPL